MKEFCGLIRISLYHQLNNRRRYHSTKVKKEENVDYKYKYQKTINNNFEIYIEATVKISYRHTDNT